MIPRRRKKPKMGLRVSDKIISHNHLKFVRGFECLCAGKSDRIVVGDDYAMVPHECVGKIEAHHVVSRGAGGDDSQVVPLCSKAHADGHRMGWETFQKRYGLDLAATAESLWRNSPAGRAYRLANPGA